MSNSVELTDEEKRIGNGFWSKNAEMFEGINRFYTIKDIEKILTERLSAERKRILDKLKKSKTLSNGITPDLRCKACLDLIIKEAVIKAVE